MKKIVILTIILMLMAVVTVAQAEVTDDNALRADVREIIPPNSTKGNPDYFHDNLLATLGFNFAFGGEKKIVESKVEEPPPPPKCPDTPAGVAVDKDGCPLDSDKDGVPDYLDKCPDTPCGVAVDKDGCPIKEEVAVKPVIEEVVVKPVIIEKGRQKLNVKFNFDNSTIKKGYYKDINNLVKVMKDYPDLKVVIEGHTDSVGDPAYNKKLSQKRADAVKEYMVAKGIGANRIKALGFGEYRPIASNKTSKGRMENRRVEAAVNYLIKK